MSESKKLRRDRHTVSLLTDHMVFSPKYRGKVLVGEVAMVAEVGLNRVVGRVFWGGSKDLMQEKNEEKHGEIK